MKSKLLLIVSLLISYVNFGQSVKGVISSLKKPVSNVTIYLKKGNAISKVEISDAKGQFEFAKTDTGIYTLSAEIVGFENYNSEPFTLIKGQDLEIGISLTAVSKELQTVTVTAQKKLIEQKPGKYVMNVEAAPTNAGLNALELLEKTPGVTLDNNDNISLKGKQGVIILIDGKQTFLSGTDLAAFLKNMQSSQLDQIEVMTNPSSKYDAAGNAGVINIKTKKQTIKGLNGSINANYAQGVYARPNISTNFNYRNNKLNIFGNYYYGQWNSRNLMNLERVFYEADKSTVSGSSDQFNRQRSKWNNHSFKLGVDYYFSKKTVAGITANFGFNNGGEKPTGYSNLRDANGLITSTLLTAGENKRKTDNVTTNFNIKHTIDSTGKEITADIDMAVYNMTGLPELNTTSLDANKNIVSLNQLQGNMPSKINIYSAKVDYVHPFTKKMKLETGIKSSIVNTDNLVNYLRNDNNSGWQYDNRSNHFKYEENINAAYAIMNASIKKWQLNAGLRVENTNAKGHQLTNDSSFKRNYTNLFPNAGVSYELNDKNQFSASYARRITRPDYEDLNPFVHFLDSLTYNQGNPYLQPQFSNNFELSYTLNNAFTATVNYTKANDVITMILKQNTDKKLTYQFKENLNTQSQIGLSLMYNKNLTKWWSVNAYANIFSNNFKGTYNNAPLDIDFTGLSGNLNNSFKFNKGWGAEVSGFYISKRNEGLLYIKNMWQMNAGVSKQLFNKKGMLKLGVRDIFLTNQLNGLARYDDVNIKLSGRKDSRQFALSFTYRFGKQSIGSERKRNTNSDEQNRVRN